MGYFWSGKPHRTVKGLNLITLYYTDIQGQYRPVNYRVYDQSEGKTQNDYFLERPLVHQHDWHWQVEQSHRVIKPVCNMESFQVCGKVPILNHLFAAGCSYIHLTNWRVTDVINNIYRLPKDLFKEVVATFINSFILDKEYLNPKFRAVVNA